MGRPEVTNDRRKFHEIELAPGPDPASQPARGGFRLAFGPYELDPETGRLRDGNRVIPLAPKPLETLLYLAQRAGHVVPKAELIDALWPGTFVTEDVLVQCIVDIRRALGDSAKTPRFIETIPRRGYRFIPTAEQRPIDPATPQAMAGLPVVAAPGDAGGGRRGRGVAVSVALTAILGGGWALSTIPRQPPATAAAPIEAGSLLVLPIRVEEPTAENQWLREGLAEILRTELSQKPGVHPVARHRLQQALNAAGLEEADGADALGLARRLGAEHLVSGSFVRVGDRFVLTAQRLDGATGAPAASASVRGRYPAELLDAVDALSVKLLESWDAGDAQAASFRPVRLATRSIDAYRQYVEALAWFARGGSRGAEEAERRLDEAIALDPSFAYAYLKKAELALWRQRLGYGAADPSEAIRAASRLAGQLGERERLLVEAMEALALRRDTEQALVRCERLLRLHPTFADEVGVPRLMAEIGYAAGRWDDLIALGEKHVDSVSLPSGERAQLSALLAKAYRQKGEFERALSGARRAVRLWPLQEGPGFLRQRSDLGRISLDAGRRDEAIAEFRAVAASAEADASNLTDAAWGLYMAGEPAEAEPLAERALALEARYGNAHHLRGWLRLARGDYAEAAASLERAFELTPSTFGAAHLGFLGGDVAALYYAGVAYRKLGDEQRARNAFERVARICRSHRAAAGTNAGGIAEWEAESYLALSDARLGRPVTEPSRLVGDDATYFLQSARLHALLGHREEALRQLAQAFALARGERQHVFDDPNFDGLRADLEFRRLVGKPAAS